MAGRILAMAEALEQPREPNPTNAKQRPLKNTIFSFGGDGRFAEDENRCFGLGFFFSMNKIGFPGENQSENPVKIKVREKEKAKERMF